MGRLAGIGWLLVLLAAACSRDPGPREPVRGRVYFQGQPFPGFFGSSGFFASSAFFGQLSASQRFRRASIAGSFIETTASTPAPDTRPPQSTDP